MSDTVFGSLLGGKGGCALTVYTVLNRFMYCWKPVIDGGFFDGGFCDGGFFGFGNQPGDELRGLFICFHVGYGKTAS